MKQPHIANVTVPLTREQYRALKQLAKDEQRSMGAQIIAMIKDSLKLNGLAK